MLRFLKSKINKICLDNFASLRKKVYSENNNPSQKNNDPSLNIL